VPRREESRCFGLSWQVAPEGMEELFSATDAARAQRAMAAMLKMGRIDIAAIQAAADGVPAS
jgi:predicted 3-demethylubiquinone-9 3-methyltransferase (glyoxalase superfamily)